MLIGITGPSGAGKGCVAAYFARRGFAVIDADRIAREVVMPGQPALARLSDQFGGEIIRPDGTLDRRLLAQRAFSSEQGTEALNGILLGEICQRMTALAGQYGKHMHVVSRIYQILVYLMKLYSRYGTCCVKLE